MKRKKYLCPICNNKLVDIIYGMPCGDTLIKKAQAKKIYLGGCMINTYNPIFHCYHCDKDFYKEDITEKE